MNWILELPGLVKIFLSFGVILSLNRLKLPLSLAMVLGAVVLGVMMGMAPWDIASVLFEGMSQSRTLSLALLITIILILSRLMAEGGQLDRIVSSFTRLVRSTRAAGIVMPAIIGLLPMPGGALFSAPMVETACRRSDAGPESMAIINYWFRHIWEYWWPLYPGVILAVSLLGVDAWRFIVIQLPFTVISVLGGLIFLATILPGRSAEFTAGVNEGGASPSAWSDFRKAVRPITIVVLTIPAVKLVEWIFGMSLPSLSPVFIGLVLCLGTVIWQNRPAPKRIAAAAFNRSTIQLVLLIVTIMGFQAMLIQSRVVDLVQHEMVRYGIPTMLVIVLMPFLSGFITGIAVGFVGASFPLIIPLLDPGQGTLYLSQASLAYAFGFMGMMLSPVHVCFLVSRDYFSAGAVGSYRRLVGPVAVVLAGALAWFGLIRLFA